MKKENEAMNILSLMASQRIRSGNSKAVRQQKTTSCAISSPAHGLVTVMEVAPQNAVLHTSLNQGAASKIDTKSNNLPKRFQLCHVATSFP